MARKTLRDGNTMIAVETASAVIDYADIVAATEVVEDRFENMTPWDHCDGFAHMRQDPRDLDDAADASAMQGYGRDSDGDRVVLQLTAGEDYGIYEHLRARGASKQVVRGRGRRPPQDLGASRQLVRKRMGMVRGPMRIQRFG